MKATGAGDPALSGLSDEQLVTALRAHPDVLRRHPELLDVLDVPHDTGGGAVSLIEAQVNALRGRCERTERRLETLLRTARDNEAISLRLHNQL